MEKSREKCECTFGSQNKSVHKQGVAITLKTGLVDIKTHQLLIKVAGTYVPEPPPTSPLGSKLTEW